MPRVPASPTAQCPFCHRLVRLVSSDGVGMVTGGCKHVREMSQIDGQEYVEFQEWSTPPATTESN